MRSIDAGDIQRFVAAGVSEGLDPKTIRNQWGTISLIWNAALAQKYVDALLPKPKLPRRPKKKAKFFTLSDVAQIIATSEGENRVFYWLAAETGLRAGELAGLKLSDIDGERLTVNRSIWNGKEQNPKTNNALRSLRAVFSAHFAFVGTDCSAKGEGIRLPVLFVNRASHGHERVPPSQDDETAQVPENPSSRVSRFSSFQRGDTGCACVPLKTIQERLGHALTGSFTLDVYGGQPEWGRNLEAARAFGAELEKAVNEAETKMHDETGTGLNYALTAPNEAQMEEA